MVIGDNPSSLGTCELGTLRGKTWSLSPSKPGSQALPGLCPSCTDLLEYHSSIRALCVQVLQCGGHRLESSNGRGSSREQVNGCPENSQGHVHAMYDHAPIYIDKKIMVGRGLY